MITSTTDAVKSQAGKREDQVAVGKFHLSIVYILDSMDLRRTLRSLRCKYNQHYFQSELNDNILDDV